MNLNTKRKFEGGDGAPPKKFKKEPFNKKGKGGPSQGGRGPGGGGGDRHWKNNQNQNNQDDNKKRDWKPKNPQDAKAKGNKIRSANKKKQLTSIVTEAKANYQLFADKKADKKEKQLLMETTFNLVKDHIPELARMKGMGKIIAALIDNPHKQKQRQEHVLGCYKSPEEKLLLMKGNGYRLAVKLIQTGTPKVVSQFVEALMTNSKGLRSLMSSNFKSARSLNAAYVNTRNPEQKRKILGKLVLGNMPISSGKGSLAEIFATCKEDLVTECYNFLQGLNLNEKSIQYDVIQDVLAICLETHSKTGMDISEFLKLCSENIVKICRRLNSGISGINLPLPLWVVWLSTAQNRKHIMKGLKGKIQSLAQTQYGRMFFMALFECTDDTKALDKFVLKELIESIDALVQNTEGRKILEFLLAPRSTKFMHPKDIAILQHGDSIRTSKKSDETRFDEIRAYLQEGLVTALKNNYEDWLKDNKMCLFIITIVDVYGVSFSAGLIQKLTKPLTSPEFSERISDKAIQMVLEALVNADCARFEIEAETSSDSEKNENEAKKYFINEFIPALEHLQEHRDKLTERCVRLLLQLIDATDKLKNVITVTPKKTWLFGKKAQDAIKKYKTQVKGNQSTQKKK